MSIQITIGNSVEKTEREVISDNYAKRFLKVFEFITILLTASAVLIVVQSGSSPNVITKFSVLAVTLTLNIVAAVGIGIYEREHGGFKTSVFNLALSFSRLIFVAFALLLSPKWNHVLGAVVLSSSIPFLCLFRFKREEIGSILHRITLGELLKGTLIYTVTWMIFFSDVITSRYRFSSEVAAEYSAASLFCKTLLVLALLPIRTIKIAHMKSKGSTDRKLLTETIVVFGYLFLSNIAIATSLPTIMKIIFGITTSFVNSEIEVFALANCAMAFAIYAIPGIQAKGNNTAIGIFVVLGSAVQLALFLIRDLSNYTDYWFAAILVIAFSAFYLGSTQRLEKGTN